MYDPFSILQILIMFVYGVIDDLHQENAHFSKYGITLKVVDSIIILYLPGYHTKLI